MICYNLRWSISTTFSFLKNESINFNNLWSRLSKFESGLFDVCIVNQGAQTF